ncbi:sugar ABC transporter ATP-binding protein [Acidisoma sp. S159]|uniref:sugar ABC transporter ATP-binding protein n=1 Tax=Acidisoma sp. S159 TaxID=1747225 RepID=UPI0020B13C83|nr:sugar ABC transporter ATP-binding protein [Acidisoma sp. S159]
MRVEGIRKNFPGVVALNGVSFDLRAGEVHALCGENGAGKSTLMKILAGSQAPDTGVLLFKGRPVVLASPLEAKEKGILLIHQEISLVPELSVAENLFLGSLPLLSFGRVDRKTLLRRAKEVLESNDVGVSPKAIAGELSIAKQQMVEIARASAFQCQVVIFDEPTASLTETETEALFETIQRLRHQGVAIAYISHKMKEIFRVSDRVTVLRDGEVRGTLQTRETNEDEVTRLMIGRTLDRYFHRAKRRLGAEVLRVENLSVTGFARNVSFSLRAGEILGLYGLVGAGRSETAEAIFGLRTKTSGEIFVNGREVKVRSAKDALRLGLGLVPEDRKKQGLVLTMGSRQNTGLALLRQISKFGFVANEREETIYQSYRKKLDIRSATSSAKVGTLSGGNQQKIVLAKWLATKPKLLILDEPTRGIDVGAKTEVHSLISDLAEQGLAVLLISSEMPEIMGLSHRILTMQQGIVTGEFDAESVTEEELVVAIMHRSTIEAGVVTEPERI